MDKIQIVDLDVACRVGVPEEERSKPQRLLISIEMAVDFSDAARQDDLTKTIDYSAVSRRVFQFVEGRNWKLIEKLSVDLAEIILLEFKPEEVTIEIKKFVIPEARYVSVQISRAKI